MRSVINKLTLSSILFLLVNTVHATNLDAAGVIKAYTQWCAAIGSAKGNSQDLVKFYAAHAVLVPTLSNKILFNDNHGLDHYFKNLTSNKNIRCSTKRLITEINNDDSATTTGFYTFTYDDKDGKTVTIPARFTFAYKKYNDEWLIVQHHSSKMLP
jgi:hypothetical protein